MNLSDINSLVSYVIKDLKPDLVLVKPLFERLLHKAQSAQYAEYLSAFETTKVLSAELSPFKRNMGEKTQPLVIDKWGRATPPSDFYYPSHGRYRMIKNGVFVGYYDVVFLDDKNYNDRIGSNLFRPTFEYPIGNVQNGYIRFAPANLKRIEFDYLTFPVYPVYAVTTTRGFQEFDAANSSTWQWLDISTFLIIQKLLAELNIDLTIEQVNQYQNQTQKQQQ